MKQHTPKQQKGLEDDNPPGPVSEADAPPAQAKPKGRASKRLCLKLIKLLLPLCVALLLAALVLGVLYLLHEKCEMGILPGVRNNSSGLSRGSQMELDDIQERFRTMLKELAEAKRDLEDLLRNHTTLSEEKTQLQTQLDLMKNNWEELHVEYTDLFRLKTDLQIELFSTKNNLEDLTSEHISLSGEKTAMLSRLAQIRTDWEDLKREYTIISDEKKDIQVEFDEAEKELEDLKRKHETLSEETTEFKHNLNQTQANWDDVKTLHTVLLREKSHIQTELHLIQVTKNNSCANDWEYFRGRCYFFSHDWLNWTMSRDSCVSMGGHLAIIEAEEEQVFLTNSGGGYWIGLSDSSQKGDWRWMDNSPLRDPKFWGDGQPEDDKDPDDDPIEEKCVILSWTDKHWDTVSCAGLYKRICESKAADWL
ncbi:C-type lectin domain family 4 member F-like isoform X2 [Clupea harengus]|uniref:C-type lectin domain family 4 member F-like isoform X2 n=1 Tax=Clupea harengus TaxID=7950 RepID=A0A6P8H202_CLUHA|nr:C-type lectin domain family 4 member F-like isoform X2 [Clupea harengus]